jgi:hypothetical protein
LIASRWQWRWPFDIGVARKCPTQSAAIRRPAAADDERSRRRPRRPLSFAKSRQDLEFRLEQGRLKSLPCFSHLTPHWAFVFTLLFSCCVACAHSWQVFPLRQKFPISSSGRSLREFCLSISVRSSLHMMCLARSIETRPIFGGNHQGIVNLVRTTLAEVKGMARNPAARKI